MSTTPYCSRTDLEAYFGTTEIAKWADVENNSSSTTIQDRIDRACVEGSAEVNDELRGGPYAIPLSGTWPECIIRAATVLSAIWLYTTRGMADSTNPDIAGRLSGLREDQLRVLREIKNGRRVLDYPSTVLAPAVVDADEDEDDE